MRKIPRGSGEENGFSEWGGYMEAKKAKLQDQFLKQAGEETRGGIFQGIAIFVNGYTVPSADELKRIMMTHGGMYHHYQTRKTTHIIATNLPDFKVKRLKIMCVVTPKWIVDSVQAGKLLDYRLYLLYSHQSKSQPCLDFGAAGLQNCSSNDGDGSPCENVHSQSISTLVINKSEHFASKGCEVESVSCTDSTPHDAESKEGEHTIQPKQFIAPGSVVSKDVLHPCTVTKSVRSVATSRIGTGTAVEPRFLSEFYNNSRLHHISTMGATFKQYVCKLREQDDGKFSGRGRLQNWKRNDHLMTNSSEDAGRGCLNNEEEEMLLGCTLKTVGLRKTIMHVDMDCFFVSVGLRNRPELRGMPVAVTHSKGKPDHRRDGANRQFEINFYKQRMESMLNQKHGNKCNKNMKPDSGAANSGMFAGVDDFDEHSSMSEIASCSYEARKAGVKNGMFLGSALKLCPNLKTIPYDFQDYKEVSYMLYDTVASYTLAIEAVSCDEMFVDCTEVLKETATSALEFATFLRSEIKARTGCSASTGFGSNPLQARLATKKAKPDGQFYLHPGAVANFMLDVKVEDLPGVGRTQTYRLHALGIFTCHQLQDLSLAQLQTQFGTKTGKSLFKHSRGEDSRSLITVHQRKSVSAEVNYGIRFWSRAEVEAFLQKLSSEVQTRLTEVGKKGRCITLKLMVRARNAPVQTAKFLGHGACDHITRSTTLAVAVADAATIAREVVMVQRQLNIAPSDLRGIGIQVSRLENCTTVKPGPAGNSVGNFFFRMRAEMKAVEDGNKSQKLEPDIQNVDALSVKPNHNQQCNKLALISTALPADCYLDEEVLKALPEDIRCEVLYLCQREKKHMQREPPMLQSEETGISEARASDNTRLGSAQTVTSQEICRLVREWVAAESEPWLPDVLVLACHGQRLVGNHSLIALDFILRHLYRCIVRKRCCKWQEAYRCILGKIQVTMQQTYGAKLKTSEGFLCENGQES